MISLHRSATDSHSESLNRTSWNPRAARVPGRSFLGLPGVVADGNTELRGRVWLNVFWGAPARVGGG